MTAKIKASSDGLKVTIGNAAEDALEINQTAKTIKGINGYSVGVSRTWQDVKASRVVGTTYTNDTGQDIEVSLYGTNSALATLNITVDSVILRSGASTATTQGLSNRATVPDGATYVVSVSSGTLTVVSWDELRP